MTRKEVKYGCLSKSLQKFLSIANEQKRRKVYGNKTAAKYYERIIKSVNGSFHDHLDVLLKLPDKYIEKIDFAGQYDSIITQAVSNKFIKHTPNRFQNETINHLHLIKKDIPDGPMKKHTIQDINKVLDWLEDKRYKRK